MFKILNRIIGKGSPVFIVAEMSANHMQNFTLAVKIIKAAKEAGADAIKLQTFTPDTMTIDCNNEYFKIRQNTIWDGKSLYQLYKRAYLPWEWQAKLKEIAEGEGLIFFSTPSDKTSVDFLEEIGVPAYKIASFEITDIPLIRYVASKGKPIIFSSGIATIEDLLEIMDVCKEVGNNQIAILKCVSDYPTSPEEVNLKSIAYMQRLFGIPIGLSDHTLGWAITLASISLGVCIIEKHICLDRKMNSLDSMFSLEPEEFKVMVREIREVEQALGSEMYIYTERMMKAKELSRSLFAVKDIKKGEVFTENNVKSIRPGYGLCPKYLDIIIGKKAKYDIKRGTPLKKELIDNIN